MSMFKKKKKEARSVSEIHQEYQSVAAAIGDRHYKVKLLEAQISQLVERANGLGKESTEALQRESDLEAKEAKDGEAK